MHPSSFQRNAPASKSDYPIQCRGDEDPNYTGYFEPSIQSDGALWNYGPGMASIPAQQHSDPFSSGGASAGAAHLFFAETDIHSLSYATSTQESPTPVLSSPHFGGYHLPMASLKGSTSPFYDQDQYTSINNTTQLDPYLQLTDFGTTGQLYAQPSCSGAGGSQDQPLADANILHNNPILAYPPAFWLPTSPPAQVHSQTFQMPTPDHASGSSATSLSPVTPTLSSPPTLGTVVGINMPSFHPESVEQPKPRLAWMQPEEPEPVEVCQSPLAKADKKRTIDDRDIVNHNYGTAAPSSTGIGPQSAKRSRTSASRAETTVEALNANTIDSKASSYSDNSPASSAAGGLRVSAAGPSNGPLVTPGARRREELTLEQWIQWLRSLENKDLQAILIRTEKISDEDKSKCCWEGCTNRPRRRPWDVLRHIRTAHLEQYAMCDLCHKVFKREDSKRRHMRTEHPQQYAASTIGNSRKTDSKCRRGVLKADRG